MKLSTNESGEHWLEGGAMLYLKSLHSEMIRLKRRIDVADFRFAMLLWDIHKQVRYPTSLILQEDWDTRGALE